MNTSKIVIRETTEDDIDAINRLYSFTTDIDELRWALFYPLHDNSVRSFIAVANNDKVVGHIGYVISKYTFNKLEFSGIHPIFWIVDPNYRKKGIGLGLMKKVISIGDFAFIIGGAASSHALYPSLNLNFKFHIKIYYKLINPLRYFKTIEGHFLKKIFKTFFLLPGALKKNTSEKYKYNLTLELYKGNSPLINKNTERIFLNTQDERYINWLLSCPLVETRAFTIKKDNDSIAIVVCYVNNRNGTLTGRIVHLSYLGDDLNLWRSALSRTEEFLKQRGCVIISTLASHPNYIRALRDLGYISTAKSRRPFFLADTKNILADIPNEAWYLTFLEGDMGYRGV